MLERFFVIYKHDILHEVYSLQEDKIDNVYTMCYTMFIWDPTKNEKLKKERGVSFEEVEQIVLRGEHLAVAQNPTHNHQYVFIVTLGEYVHIVPFVYDKDDNIILKTIYPSRKHHKRYAKKIS